MYFQCAWPSTERRTEHGIIQNRVHKNSRKTLCQQMANENYEPRETSHLENLYSIWNSAQVEPYLYLVNNPKYKIAISKLRTSSHKLEIERSLYTRPITPREKRICHQCKVVEDKFHFMLQCYIYTVERDDLLKKSSCGSIASRFTSGRQICISHDLK